MTNSLELSSAVIDYEDTGDVGGQMPVLLLLHGLLMDTELWTQSVSDLTGYFRCVVPTLPLGAHSHPRPDDADHSLPAIAELVIELMDRLGLEQVIVAGNDTGGALAQLLVANHPDRFSGLVLISCDAYDNFPPGLTGRTLVRTGKLAPRMFGAFMQQMRMKPVRRMPMAFGWLTKRGDAMTVRWAKPVLSSQAIRKDTVRVLRGISAAPTLLIDVAEPLTRFPGPTLIVWAEGDRVMPPEHGRRLAAELADTTYVEIADTYSLIPLDQPSELAKAIRHWARV